MQTSQTDTLDQLKNLIAESFGALKTKRQRNLVQLVTEEKYKTPPFKGGGEPFRPMPDQVGIMLMWLHPDVLQLVMRKAVQRGATEIAVAAHMLLIERGESSVYVMPNAEMAGALDKSIKHWQTYEFVRQRMLADPDKMRDSRNKIKEKQYDNCSQYFFGAGGAGSTSQYTVSFATADEAEKIEGDPSDQGSIWAGFDGRFAGLLRPGRKRIFSSPQSPDGIISELLKDCKHIMECEIPCPLCGEFSTLRWGDKSDDWGIKFDESGTVEERSESVRHVCKHCKDGWTHNRYKEVIDDCRWVSESGYWYDCNEGDDGDFKKKLGSDWDVVKAPYKIGIQHTDDGAGLYGRSDWSAAVRNCIDYTEAEKKRGNGLHLKRFVNEFRAKPYQDLASREIPTHELLARREQYSHPIPAEVQMLVVGIDFGLKYSNYELMGFGADGVCWAIKRERFDGDALDEDSRMFTSIEPVLKKEYQTEDGRMLPVAVAIMDGRYAQANVQKLASVDPYRRIVVYGDGKNPRKPLFDYDPKKDWNEEAKCFEVTINPHKASARLYHKLAVPRGESGFYHIPDTEDYGRLWADEITSDKKKKRKINNQWIDVYEKDHSGIAGEAHDTAKYCLTGNDVALDYGLGEIDEDFEPYRGKKMSIPEQVTPQPTTPTFDISDAY